MDERENRQNWERIHASDIPIQRYAALLVPGHFGYCTARPYTSLLSYLVSFGAGLKDMFSMPGKMDGDLVQPSGGLHSLLVEVGRQEMAGAVGSESVHRYLRRR